MDAIITLTDTDGFLALSPDGKEVRAERTWEPDSKLVVNHNSRVGREGQYDKLHAIIRAINSGAVKVNSLSCKLMIEHQEHESDMIAWLLRRRQ